MKVLSYNILSGGFTSYNDYSAIPQRLDKLSTAIKWADADLVTFIDTYRWHEILSTERIQNVFGYPKAFSITLDDERLVKSGCINGITVLSRVPQTSFEKIRIANRNAIKSKVILNNREIDLFSIYLDDHNEDNRLLEVKALEPMIDKQKATVLTGDFNAIDKDDLSVQERELLTLLAKLPKVNYMGPSLEEMKRSEVTQYIKKMGFVDADEYKKRMTIPTKLFPVFIPKPILRLDYCFYNNKARVSDFEVLYGPQWDMTSDHYPITFEIS